jgi:predicted CXXCH cytochrome family protein
MLSGVTGVVVADEGPDSLLPVIPAGQGDSCVKDTGFMRRNHMELLKHQRDETMLRGVRTEQFSLQGCLSCHVVYGADAVAVTVASPEHFCRSCHDYAAVSIDCFQCHASRPGEHDVNADHQVSSAFPGTSGVQGRE